MFKKSLLFCALATCGLTAAHAVNVEVYGLIDYGFSLSRTSGNADNAIPNEWSFEAKSGMRNSSRVGFRGTEEFLRSRIFRCSFGSLRQTHARQSR